MTALDRPLMAGALRFLALAGSLVPVSCAACTCSDSSSLPELFRARAESEGIPASSPAAPDYLIDARASGRQVFIVVQVQGAFQAVSFDLRGHERWRRPAAEHVFLGPTAADPIVEVHHERDGAPRHIIILIDPRTGRPGRSFTTLIPSNPVESWARDGGHLLAAELAAEDDPTGPGPTGLYWVNLEDGEIAWSAVHPRRIWFADLQGVPGGPVAFTSDSIFVPCRTKDPLTKSCQIAAADGSEVDVLPEIHDHARLRDDTLVLLFTGYVEAISTLQSKTHWRTRLPENCAGSRIGDAGGWIAVLATCFGDDFDSPRDDRQILLAFDPRDGRERWRKLVSEDEHYLDALSTSGGRALYLSDVAPYLRVIDGAGQQVLSADLSVPPERALMGSGLFMGSLLGRPVLSAAPATLIFSRPNTGLEIHPL